MPRAKPTAKVESKTDRLKVQTVPLEYAGKWIAWSADGRRIVAVAGTYNACELAAATAGHSANEVAIERVPRSRQRLTGSGM
jgi:hypothetical protein